MLAAYAWYLTSWFIFTSFLIFMVYFFFMMKENFLFSLWIKIGRPTLLNELQLEFFEFLQNFSIVLIIIRKWDHASWHVNTLRIRLLDTKANWIYASKGRTIRLQGGEQEVWVRTSFFFLQPGKASFFYFQYLMGQVFFFLALDGASFFFFFLNQVCF